MRFLNITFRTIIYLTCVQLVLALSMPACTSPPTDTLQEEFEVPPHPAKPWVYWINMDGHFTREGITADLEAMKEVGIGGVIHMDVDVGVPRGETHFMSRKWQENFKHAILECERLELELTTISGPGWAGTGGPWIKAEHSMQHLVPVSVNVQGPEKFNQILPEPQPRVSIYHLHQTPQMSEALSEFYEDVAVYAFPRRDALIPDIMEKAFFHREPYSSASGTRAYLPSPVSYPELDEAKVIDPKTIIDLTDRLQADGRLEWEIPPGEWTILRMGRRSTGSNTRPAAMAGMGFESDKFDKQALTTHFNAYIDTLVNLAGPRPKDRKYGFTGLDHDSWEMSTQNWTQGFREEFQRRRGYDPWPYFPVYSGRVVGSKEISERFLWDIRMTSQELVLENHIGQLKELCHKRGLKLAIEPYCMNPTNCLDLGAMADLPMGEFWNNFFNTSFSCLIATSAAHVTGKSIVPAEAFTAYQTYWRETPWTMKNQGDWAFAMGINRFVIVSFAHQPWLDRAPGMMFAMYGLHWERTQTFWPLLSGYHQYLARCSHLLQQGVTVSDILYLTPEGPPHIFNPPSSAVEGSRLLPNPLSSGEEVLPDKKGYGFDGCSANMLMERATVQDGRIVFPGGSSYRLLVLPHYQTMTPQLLTKIESLVKAGASIVGSPSLKSPSLSNYPDCDEELRLLALKLWGSLETPDNTTRRKYGKGTIYWGGPHPEELFPEYTRTASVLMEMGVDEDFTATGPVRYGHRRTDLREIYFLSNKSDRQIQVECTFRVSNGPAELWNPLTAEMYPLLNYNQENGLTTIPIEFAPYQSFFVIFPRKGSSKVLANTSGENFPKSSPVKTLEGSWEVSFDPRWGGPEKVIFPSLQDWTFHKEEGIRYYSGIATYRKTFDLPEIYGKRINLNLGRVHEMAEITLNGKNLGVVWCAPWKIDISGALKAKGNQLEIRVANLWPNRLIGDAARPMDVRYTWTAEGHPYNEESSLLPSGLLGPVQIELVERISSK